MLFWTIKISMKKNLLGHVNAVCPHNDAQLIAFPFLYQELFLYYRFENFTEYVANICLW